MARILKITLAYDGTSYLGWQRQAGSPSIQEHLEAALSRLDGAPVVVHGAGRTDAGVHALGQVASAHVTTSLETATVRRALNAILPADVRVLAVESAPEGFHARFSATGKTYEYWIFEGDVQPPFARAWSWHHPWALDLDAMQAAAALLVGTHDFAAFQSTGTPVRTTVRTMRRAEVRADAGPAGPGPAPDGRFVVIRLEGDGFLRHMVRAVTGTLVEIGEGRRRVDSVADLLASGDRSAAGPTAPAVGLVLLRVTYGN